MTKTHGLIGKGMSFLNKSKLVNDIEGNVVEIKACELQFCYNEDEDLVIWETYEENSRGQFPSVIDQLVIVKP